MRGSSTSGSRRLEILWAPSRRVARSTASAAASSTSSSAGLAADRRRRGRSASRRRRAARASTDSEQDVAARPLGDAGGRGDGGLARRVAVGRRAHAGDAGIGGQHGPLELDRQRRPCASVGSVGQRRAPQVDRHRLDPVGLGHAGPLVGLGEAGVVAGVGEHLGDDALVERAGRREADAVVADDPHADAEGLGRRERLHLAAVGPHGVERPGPTNTSTCSPAPAVRAIRAARSSSSGRWPARHVPLTVTSPMTSVTPAADIGQPREVGADGGDVVQHPLQGRGDGELLAPARRARRR